MPELPEVETIRRQLALELTGYTFTKVTSVWEKAFRPSFGAVKKAVVGRMITKVDRQAKLLIMALSRPVQGATSPNYLLFHLKMTGQLLVRAPKDPPDKHVRSVFSLKKGQMAKELRFADTRKFGFVKLLTSNDEMTALRSGYGPEPLGDLNLKNFTVILNASRRSIKTVLLDQSKISGVGNIYANDALWLAGIDPKTPANKITGGRVAKLYQALLTVLKRGLKYGGASDNSYVQVHGEKGHYQEHFLVYKKAGEPCLRCHTRLQRSVVGGRGTFYCPKCQG